MFRFLAVDDDFAVSRALTGPLRGNDDSRTNEKNCRSTLVRKTARHEAAKEAFRASVTTKSVALSYSKTSPQNFIKLGTMLEKDINMFFIGVKCWLICFASRYRGPTLCPLLV